MQRSKLLLKITAISFFSLLFFCCGCKGNETAGVDYEKNIDQYISLLNDDPGNCLYLEQVATNYQALNKLEKAVEFYKKTLNICSDNLTAQFQLGVCYYLMMERELGVQFMDKAIQQAHNTGETEMENMFVREKKEWLEKWDLVKELDWNKGKSK